MPGFKFSPNGPITRFKLSRTIKIFSFSCKVLKYVLVVNPWKSKSIIPTLGLLPSLLLIPHVAIAMATWSTIKDLPTPPLAPVKVYKLA